MERLQLLMINGSLERKHARAPWWKRVAALARGFREPQPTLGRPKPKGH